VEGVPIVEEIVPRLVGGEELMAKEAQALADALVTADNWPAWVRIALECLGYREGRVMAMFILRKLLEKQGGET